MNTIMAAAAVTGARHLRVARNGQDAAAAWVGVDTGAIVVCDGCSSGPSSEVGARLGAQLVIAAIAKRLPAADDLAAMWTSIRAELTAVLARIVDAMPGDRERAIHDHFLFTIVAAARRGDRVACWAIGDGGFAIGGHTRVLGPFAANQPPYVAYDLLGAPPTAHLEVVEASRGTAMVATDGVVELGLDAIDVDRAFAHPDALRRQLALLARGHERVDWEAQRIERHAARLQDDGAVAAMRWSS